MLLSLAERIHGSACSLSMVSQREFDQSIDYSLVYRPLYWLLLKIESDDHTQNWCVLVATVSTPICSVMFTPTMQYTT